MAFIIKVGVVGLLTLAFAVGSGWAEERKKKKPVLKYEMDYWNLVVEEEVFAKFPGATYFHAAVYMPTHVAEFVIDSLVDAGETDPTVEQRHNILTPIL